MFNAKHRKAGNVGSFTVHAPFDYLPRHRAKGEPETINMILAGRLGF